MTASDGSANPAAFVLFLWQVASPITITAPGAQSNTEGDAVSLQVQASDSSGGTPEYSASGLPTGLSIDSSTELISGTIAAGASANGPYAPTVTVSDGTYSASTSIPWSVANPITITDPGKQSASEGSAVSVQVQASDSISGADLSYSAVGLPTGLTINATTGLISGTPTIGSAAAGPYQTVVTVTDGTFSNSTSFAWQLTALGNPPTNPITLSNPGTQSGTEGQSVSVQVQATDSSGADLQYSAVGLPTGLSINATTGLISGTIAAGASVNGPFAATVTVQDGTFSAASSFLWQVSSPVSVTNPGNQSGSEGQSVSLQVRATDSSGGNPTFSAVNLPTGLSISSSGLISGTIAGGVSANGPFTTTVTATDGAYSGSTSFLWQVANAISMTTPTDQSSTEGEAISLPIQAGDSTSGVVLNYSASGLPTGLTVNSTTGLISGTIAAGAAANGPYTPTVTVTDGSSTASTTFTWAVANAISLTTPADQTTTEGQSVSLQIQASDSSGGTPTYAATGLPPGLTLNSATGLISGTVTLGPVNAGTYLVVLNVGDGTYSASTAFNWTVSSPITVTNPGTQSGTEGNAVSLQVQGNDPSGVSLVFSATGLPTGLTISSSGLISGTIAAGAAAKGPSTVTVTADDGTTTSSTTFLWQVSSPITITNTGTQYVGEGSAASLQMQAADSSGGTPTWSAASLPPGLTINSATGLISGTLASGAAANGPYVTTVTASDGTYSNSVQVLWQVAAPAVSGSLTLFNPGTQASTEGQSVSLQVQASDSTSGAELNYGAVGLPSGLSINASTGLITGTITPGSANLGPCLTLVSVSDGTNSVTTAFAWQIASAVTLTNPGNQSGSEGQAVSLQLQASSSSGSTPTFSAVGLPPGLGIDSATGLISGNIASGSSAYGPYQVIVTAEQGASSSSVSFAWQVSSPVTLTNPGSQSSTEGQAVSLQLQASAPSDVAVNYSAIGLPPGLVINASTGLIGGTPATGDGGPSPYLVLVTAQAGGSSASQIFSWQVSSPVSITAPGMQSSTEGQAVSLPVQATDSTSGAVVQFMATGLPLGLSINSATGLISGTVLPGAAAAGPYLVTVSAADGASSASESFWWVVSSPLTLSNPGAQASLTGTTVSLALLGSNASGGAPEYSAADLPPGLSINASTGVISGTLASTDQGVYDVTVTASSGAYSTNSTFEWLAVNTQASTCGNSSPGLSQGQTNALIRQLLGEDVGGQTDSASQLQELGGVFADPDVQGQVRRAQGRRSNDGMGKFIDSNAIDPGFGKKFPGLGVSPQDIRNSKIQLLAAKASQDAPAPGGNAPLWTGSLPTPAQLKAEQQRLQNLLAKMDPASPRARLLQTDLDRLERLEPYVDKNAKLKAKLQDLNAEQVVLSKRRQELNRDLAKAESEPQYAGIFFWVHSAAGQRARQIKEWIHNIDQQMNSLDEEVKKTSGLIRNNDADAAKPQLVQQSLPPAMVIRLREGSVGPVARTQDPNLRLQEMRPGGRGQWAWVLTPDGKMKSIPNLARPEPEELDRVLLEQYLAQKALAESPETMLDTLQGVLDLVSLVPVGGWAVAIANGGISAARGRPTDAALRFLAVAPLLGGSKKIAEVAQRAEQAVAASRTEVAAGSALAKLKGLTDAGKVAEDVAAVERQTAQALKSGALKPAELEAVLQKEGWTAAAAKQKVNELEDLGAKLANAELAADAELRSGTYRRADGVAVEKRPAWDAWSPEVRAAARERNAEMIGQLEAAGREGVSVGSLTPAKRDALFKQMAEITKGTGKEVALVQTETGDVVMVIGELDRVKLPENVHSVIGHTHPQGHMGLSLDVVERDGKWYLRGDVARLHKLNQQETWIIAPDGTAKKVSVADWFWFRK